mgnify:CR=1 FL=1
MIETTTLTPPGAHCAVTRAHDPEDNFTAYEITVDGVTIELDTVQARQVARVLTRVCLLYTSPSPRDRG